MEKNIAIRNGKIIKLAKELSLEMSSAKAAITARHYDQGHAIQLQYIPSHNHQYRPLPAVSASFAFQDTPEVRSFDNRDDRFYVESFDTGSSASSDEIVQTNNLNIEIEGALSTSAALDATPQGAEEIYIQSNLNREIEGALSNSFGQEVQEQASDEIVQQNTLSQDLELSTAPSHYSRGKDRNDETYLVSASPSDSSAAQENKALWTEPSPSSVDNDSLSSQSSFEDDIKSILTGQKLYDEHSKSLTTPGSAHAEQQENMSSQSSLNSPASESSHDIFEKISKGMSQANSYDFGTLSLEQSFDEFDRHLEKNNAIGKKLPLASQATARESRQQTLNDLDYAEDFSSIAFDKPILPSEPLTPLTEDQLRIKQGLQPNDTSSPPPQTSVPEATPAQGTEDLRATDAQPAQLAQQASYVSYAFDHENDPNWPPRPSSIRIMPVAEKERVFGRFQYQPTTGDDIQILGSWVQDNIANVRIPQLDGKLFGGRVIQPGHGFIRFHRLAQNRLIELWQAWEHAGLINKILSFQGGFTPRFIRGTAGRNPRPLSNHAWGTAFDINAPQNGFGAEPALVGQAGSVRELVEIANLHGFFWGGHFSHKDGMHFEIASPFNP